MTEHIVAVPSQDTGGLEARVSEHFGRCPWFTLVTLVDGEPSITSTVPNPAATSHRPGVVPGFVRELGADVILSGGMGRRAVAMFERWGVAVATGATGTVGEAVSAWHLGSLADAAPCAGHGPGHDHHHEGSCHEA